LAQDLRCLDYLRPIRGRLACDSPFDVQLDRFDWAILDLLMRDGRMPVTEIAAKVGLSKTPCQNRIARMRAMG
jgi:hypothetical protein